MQPLGQRHLPRRIALRRKERVLLRSPVRGRFAFGPDLQAGADNQHQEKEVQEVLPAQPGGQPHGCVGRLRRLPAVGGEEVLHRVQRPQPARGQHNGHSQHNDDGGSQGTPHPGRAGAGRCRGRRLRGRLRRRDGPGSC